MVTACEYCLWISSYPFIMVCTGQIRVLPENKRIVAEDRGAGNGSVKAKKKEGGAEGMSKPNNQVTCNTGLKTLMDKSTVIQNSKVNERTPLELSTAEMENHGPSGIKTVFTITEGRRRMIRELEKERKRIKKKKLVWSLEIDTAPQWWRHKRSLEKSSCNAWVSCWILNNWSMNN